MCLCYQEKKLLAEIKRTAKTGNEVSSAFHDSWRFFWRLFADIDHLVRVFKK